ncbi:hypothetical protein CC78DRAFT_530691, partial [Lojkania enalia]
MPSLAELPPELILWVAAYVEDEPSLTALEDTCRHFKALLSPRKIERYHNPYPNRPVRPFFHRLRAHPETAAQVKSVLIRGIQRSYNSSKPSDLEVEDEYFVQLMNSTFFCKRSVRCQPPVIPKTRGGEVAELAYLFTRLPNVVHLVINELPEHDYYSPSDLLYQAAFQSKLRHLEITAPPGAGGNLEGIIRRNIGIIVNMNVLETLRFTNIQVETSNSVSSCNNGFGHGGVRRHRWPCGNLREVYFDNCLVTLDVVEYIALRQPLEVFHYKLGHQGYALNSIFFRIEDIVRWLSWLCRSYLRVLELDYVASGEKTPSDAKLNIGRTNVEGYLKHFERLEICKIPF